MTDAAPFISGTALTMAAFRALESAKPRGERLFCDPYARRFLPEFQRALLACAGVAPLRRVIEFYADRRGPGARTSGIARTRLIDDWVSREIECGVQQIVMLGAGFDCRALRLPSISDITLFEVDRPSMIARKNCLLDRESRVRLKLKRVSADFLKDSLADRLFDAGYSSKLKTLFLWEGVTNYLDDKSVASTFDFVACNAALGSRIAFTYVHVDAVTGRFDAPGLQPLLRSLRKLGEPWTFGFNPETLPSYLAEHGLRLIADLGAAEYRNRYWTTMNRRPVGYEFYRVALAETINVAAR